MPEQSITGILRYRVPDHQDHAVLRAALLREGYQPSSELVQAEMFLMVPCTDDREVERERVRAILADVHATSLSGPDLIYTPVRFHDEPQDDRDQVDERPRSAQPRGDEQGTTPDTTRGPLRDRVQLPASARRAGPVTLGVLVLVAAAYAVARVTRRRTA